MEKVTWGLLNAENNQPGLMCLGNKKFGATGGWSGKTWGPKAERDRLPESFGCLIELRVYPQRAMKFGEQ